MQVLGRRRPSRSGRALRPRSAAGNDSGFSLVEVLVASTVLTAGIAGAVQVMHSSFDVASRTSARARAVAVAVDHIETARSTPFEDLAVADDGDPPQQTAKTVGGSEFTVKSAVTWKSNGDDGTAYKQVSVWVEWEDAAGPHEVHQESYVYPAGSYATATTLAGAGGAVPAAPSALLATLPAGVEGGVDLTWTPPPAGTPKPVRWVVQKSTDRFASRIWDVTRTEPPESSSIRVPGLAAGTTYDFRVAAVGAAGALSAWSPIATVTTAASLVLDPCQYRSVSVNPPALPRAVRGMASPLALTPSVTVETSGTCIGLSIRYESPYDGSVTVPLVRNGNVWSGDVRNTAASRWDVGPTTIDVHDGSSRKQGSLTLTVCENGTPCS